MRFNKQSHNIHRLLASVAFSLVLSSTTCFAQPYTNKPTVIVNLDALNQAGARSPSANYNERIVSVPIAPLFPGEPESITLQDQQRPAVEMLLPQASPQLDQKFETSHRQLTGPILKDLLGDASLLDPASHDQNITRPMSHDDFFEAAVDAVQNTPIPAVKPDIEWKTNAFEDILKPGAPAPKPSVNSTAFVSPQDSPQQPRSVSPFYKKSTLSSQGGTGVSLKFDQNSVSVSPAAKSMLAQVAQRLKDDPDLRLQLRAYASENPNDSISGARRLSLSRALTVRAQLMQLDIPPTRIDVRALGSDVPNGPADRVDLVIIR